MIHLGINIDHIATLRQARQGVEPDPVWAASICELAGAYNITVHLREDRRHIQSRDLVLLRETVKSKLNLEMGNNSQILREALAVKPDQVTLVPERREELTTEGGLNVIKHRSSLLSSIQKLQKKGIETGVFIEPDEDQVKASSEIGVSFVEFHTGRFANAKNLKVQEKELILLCQAAEEAHGLNLHVHAGHGLNFLNIHPIKKMPYLEEVNIGHAIISRAVFMGLQNAVQEMLNLLRVPSPL